MGIYFLGQTLPPSPASQWLDTSIALINISISFGAKIYPTIWAISLIKLLAYS
jgi:hypothetical protein